MKNIAIVSRIFLLLAFLMAGARQAAAQPAQGWKTLNTENFQIIGNASPSDLRGTADRIENFRRNFSRIFPTLKTNVEAVPIKIIVFRSAADFRPFKLLLASGGVDEAVGGYFQPGDEVNYITLSGGSAKGLRLVIHEYFHYLVSINFGDVAVASWLNEGLAQVFETAADSDERQVSPAAEPNENLRMLSRDQLLPLSDLLAYDNAAPHDGNDRARSMFYAESWLLANYLINVDQKSAEAKFTRFLSLLDGREDAAGLVRRLIGDDEAAFASTVRRIAAERPSPLVFATDLAPVTVNSELRSANVAEIDAVLGDLLAHAGRDRDAAEFLNRALMTDSSLKVARESYGLLLLKQKRYIEAAKYLMSSSVAEPSNFYVYYGLALSLVRQAADASGRIEKFSNGNFETIAAALEKSIALKPDFAEAFRLLGFVLLVENRNLGRAAELARRAISLKPESDESRLLLTQILLRQEKYADADTEAKQLVALATDEQIRADAREVIDAAGAYFTATAEAKQLEPINSLERGKPLILKRSSLTEAEIAAFDRDRIITNLNLLLGPTNSGEQRVTGYVERIRCKGENVSYVINVGGRRSILSSVGFDGVRFAVLMEGKQAFRLECGAGFGKQLTVLTYLLPKSESSRRLVGLAFVPEMFRLKTPAEMAKTRLVVIEDDIRR